MLALVAFAGWQLVVLFLLTLCCYSAGSLFTSASRFRSVSERFAISTGLGLGVYGTALFLIGLGGFLDPVVVIFIAVIPVGILAPRTFRGWRAARPVLSLRSDIRWMAAIGACLIPSFVLSLYPPTAFDATLYHLPYAKRFAAEHAVVVIETLRYPVFPQLNEMLFTAMLMLSSDVSASLVQLLFLYITAICVYCWGAGHKPSTGMLAAALLIGSPILVYLSATAYVDVGLTAFATLTLYALHRWSEQHERHWLLLAGAFAGFAAGTKYLGLYFVAVVPLILLATSGRRWLRHSAASLFIAALVCTPWYLRNFVETANPVFPFLEQLFESSMAWESRLDDRALASLSQPLRSIQAWEWIWRFALDRGTLKGHPPLSPFFFMLAPLLVYGAISNRSLRTPMLALLVYVAMVGRSDVRFLLPALPIMSIAAAYGLSRFLQIVAPRRITRAITTVTLVCFIAPGAAWASYHLTRLGPVPVTGRQREAFLERRVAPYEALSLLNHLHGKKYTVYAIDFESAAYFADGRFLGDVMGPWRYQKVRKVIHDPRKLQIVLQSMSADYFLGPPGIFSTEDREVAHRFQQVLLRDRFVLYRVLPLPE